MANFAHSLDSFGDNPALISATKIVTYSELHTMAARTAERLGERPQLVFLEASNNLAAICTYVACLMGGHPVHLFGAQDGDKTRHLITTYRPNRVFAERDGVLSLQMSQNEPIDLHPSLRVLLATSGSTGSPKLVKLSQENIGSNAESIAEYLRLNSSERALTSLRFSYSYGMSIVNSHLACGGALVLTDFSVVDAEFWQLFHEYQATSFAGVPYTFETLHKMDKAIFQRPHFRYATQAGGRLSAELVKYYAQLSQTCGWRFYVMYGQTEASPRMAYLPPEQAAANPHCIGIPIPGGRISLLDQHGRQIEADDTPGELAYRGPNIMMGYAEDRSDLCTDHTPQLLLTGDVACRNRDGLYYITGRSSRFVKPFGIRVNLDDVETHIRAWAPNVACAGAKERILVAMTQAEMTRGIQARLRDLPGHYGLPHFAFEVLEYPEIPRLANGKPDYQSIVRRFESAAGVDESRAPKYSMQKVKRALSLVLSRDFLRQLKLELLQLLGIGNHRWHGVADIFSTVLSGRVVSANDTFTDLAGDSLSYVQASLAIEEYLKRLPRNWERMTVAELEQHRTGAASI
jgi:acyl-coenzyme A synthetase/AMP-(fatty) acid ligase